MSFADYDIEAQKPVSAVATVSQSLTSFVSNLASLEKLNKQIGTKRDGKKLRAKIETQLNKESDNLVRIKDQIFNLQLSLNGDTANDTSVILSKLQKEVQVVSDNFNSLVRSYNEKKNSVIISDFIKSSGNDDSASGSAGSATAAALADDSSSNDAATESTPLIQVQENQINQYDMDFHDLLVQQREANLSEIHQGVAEINTIFKDINSLVLEQGVQVDTIENNITNLAGDTQNAAQELMKANEYQKRKGKCSCIVLVILTVVALLIVLAIFA